MRKNIFTLMALMAALCACNKEQFIESEITEPDIETSASLVFTATMESTPGTKATLDGMTPSWEVDDPISVNGTIFKAKSAGASTTLREVIESEEIRPAFVSGSPVPDDNTTPPNLLVDAEGTRTKWCDHVNGDGLFIIVSTGNDCMLNSIKLWNGGDTGSRTGRRWKDVKVYGASSADGPWDSDALLASFTSLNLEANNGGFAGELPVNSTKECKYYRVEVLSTMGESLQQMSDMKFVVTPSIPAPYDAYFPSNLYDGTTTVLPSAVTETWADGKFNMPMYAHSTTTDLQFKNLCGVLKIAVKNDQMAAVKSITVSSTNCATSGAFTVDSNNAAVLAAASNTANTVTVIYTTAVTTDATGKVFYVAIPAQTYQNLSVAVSDGTTTKVMTTKKDQNITVARNTVYLITFDGEPIAGTAKATINNSEVDVKWVQLWAGGPRFAEYNVGAKNRKAEDYGGYYNWGMSEVQTPSNYNNYNSGTALLSGNDDTATKLWGSNWRMPTQSEFNKLLSNCNVAWTTVNSQNGRKFTGKGAYASNSVFLPAAGDYYYGWPYRQGISGNYWSSTPNNGNSANNLYFSSDHQYLTCHDRYFGYSIRPVLAE